jgi:hypothetical protein
MTEFEARRYQQWGTRSLDLAGPESRPAMILIGFVARFNVERKSLAVQTQRR